MNFYFIAKDWQAVTIRTDWASFTGEEQQMFTF